MLLGLRACAAAGRVLKLAGSLLTHDTCTVSSTADNCLPPPLPGNATDESAEVSSDVTTTDNHLARVGDMIVFYRGCMHIAQLTSLMASAHFTGTSQNFDPDFAGWSSVLRQSRHRPCRYGIATRLILPVTARIVVSWFITNPAHSHLLLPRAAAQELVWRLHLGSTLASLRSIGDAQVQDAVCMVQPLACDTIINIITFTITSPPSKSLL